jgi:hypothetical protein
LIRRTQTTQNKSTSLLLIRRAQTTQIKSAIPIAEVAAVREDSAILSLSLSLSLSLARVEACTPSLPTQPALQAVHDTNPRWRQRQHGDGGSSGHRKGGRGGAKSTLPARSLARSQRGGKVTEGKKAGITEVHLWQRHPRRIGGQGKTSGLDRRLKKSQLALPTPLTCQREAERRE